MISLTSIRRVLAAPARKSHRLSAIFGCRPRTTTTTTTTNSRLYFSNQSKNTNTSSTSNQHYGGGDDDPYQVFREPSEELWKLMERERERTRLSIDSTLRLEIESDIETLVAQMPASIPESGPTGRYLYSTSTGLDGQMRYSRRRSTSSSAPTSTSEATDATDEVVLNLNLNEYELKAMSLSVDETFLAYITSTVMATAGDTENDKTQLWIKDLRSTDDKTAVQIPTDGQLLAFVEWGPRQQQEDNGSHSLFFTTTDAWHRPESVWVASLVVDDDLLVSNNQPIQIYHNSDETVLVDVQRTKGCQYVAISASTKTTNEVYLVSSELSKPPLLVRPRQVGVQYHLDVGANGDVYLLASSSSSASNDDDGLDDELTLFQTHVDSLPLDTDDGFGTLLVAGTATNDDDFAIVDMDLFRDVLVLYKRSIRNGSQRLRIIKRSDDGEGDCVVDISPHQLMNPCGNMNYNAPSVQFNVESPVMVPLTYDYNFSDQTTISSSSLQQSSSSHHPHIISLKEAKHDDDKYVHTRVLVENGNDGVQVPLTLIHKQDVDPFQRVTNPVVLVGYGAYGEPVMPGYDPTVAAPLVDRGVIMAYAHTRGGGDLGRAWYHGGRLYNKRNAVDDYHACAQYLVDTIVKSPTQLTAKAFSAGGVTVGAAVNRSPELFGSVVFVNAFLDVTTSMTTKMALTEHEYDEWGDPTVDQKAADLIASYCPMTNLKSSDQTYPRMLIIGTLDDTNVPYWHALSFHAKLSSSGDDPNRHFVYMVPQGGHHMHGSSLEVASLTNAFILQSSRSTD